MFDYTNYKDYSNYNFERVLSLDSSHVKAANCELMIFYTPDEVFDLNEIEEEYTYAAEYSNADEQKLYLLNNFENMLDLSNCYGTLNRDNTRLFNYTTDFQKSNAEVYACESIGIDELFFIKKLDNFLSSNGSIVLDLDDKKQSKFANLILKECIDPNNKWDSVKEGNKLRVFNIEVDNVLKVIDEVMNNRELIESQIDQQEDPTHLDVHLFIDDVRFEDIIKTSSFNEFDA